MLAQKIAVTALLGKHQCERTQSTRKLDAADMVDVDINCGADDILQAWQNQARCKTIPSFENAATACVTVNCT